MSCIWKSKDSVCTHQIPLYKTQDPTERFFTPFAAGSTFRHMNLVTPLLSVYKSQGQVRSEKKLMSLSQNWCNVFIYTSFSELAAGITQIQTQDRPNFPKVPSAPPLWAMVKTHHLVNLFLDDNSAYFFPALLPLMQRKSYPHGKKFWTGRGDKTEKNVVDKRNETDIGGHNGKAWTKSRTNTTNNIRRSCDEQLGVVPLLLGISSPIYFCRSLWNSSGSFSFLPQKNAWKRIPPSPLHPPSCSSEFPFTTMYGQWHLKNTDSDH